MTRTLPLALLLPLALGSALAAWDTGSWDTAAPPSEPAEPPVGPVDLTRDTALEQLRAVDPTLADAFAEELAPDPRDEPTRLDLRQALREELDPLDTGAALRDPW